jgi:ankyrin repeat protein
MKKNPARKKNRTQNYKNNSAPSIAENPAPENKSVAEDQFSNANAASSDGSPNSAIRYAVAKQDYTAVKQLIDNQADVNIHAPEDRKTPLQMAVELGNKKIYLLLIAAKADIHATSNGRCVTESPTSRHMFDL